MDYNLSVEDIKEWLKMYSTRAFMERISLHLEDSDKQVHIALAKKDLNEAALHNAGKVVFEEVLDIPQIMIDEIIKEKENK